MLEKPPASADKKRKRQVLSSSEAALPNSCTPNGLNKLLIVIAYGFDTAPLLNLLYQDAGSSNRMLVLFALNVGLERQYFRALNDCQANISQWQAFLIWINKCQDLITESERALNFFAQSAVDISSPLVVSAIDNLSEAAQALENQMSLRQEEGQQLIKTVDSSIHHLQLLAEARQYLQRELLQFSPVPCISNSSFSLFDNTREISGRFFNVYSQSLNNNHVLEECERNDSNKLTQN